ncbi:hypothetical protein LSH36_227g01034 [Paralvinella palmiformis]|uniref:Uncharacterized protein n=1 Tax=Paralvinella palmiformis TaxID=53620 RepID=A0AAD9JNY6_9ANNE|nr:hypothetical protein LSH36_227g01034 [Paralvinella palmiformis]
MDEINNDDPVPSLSAPSNLVRAANRLRQNPRPQDSIDLDFNLSEDVLPVDFFRKGITSGNDCYLLFASQIQLNQLATAKTWYLDGTFKIVRQPFTQLITAHAFLKHDGNTKQLAFCSDKIR